MVRLSVVIPVRDEAEKVGPLAAEVDAALRGRYDYEIVFVDDGSRDGTGGKIADAARRNRRVRLVQHEDSCGQSTAIWSGVREARGEWIATLDGDGQNDPADIPRLMRVLETATADERLGMVVGHRVSRQDGRLRRIASPIANAVRAWMLRDATPDSGCGLKVFPRERYLDLPYFDHMHRFLPALMLRSGYRVRTEPVNHRPREGGRSKYGLLDRLWIGVADLLGMFWLMRRDRRPPSVRVANLQEAAAEDDRPAAPPAALRGG
jgi:dolichol-phosphate mannosyltransferase